ncbi:Protein FMP42 [Ceratocystis lukuohia]|uniref:Protein FMP42 n=1 Tax=Ceratocystis lukuohia TaxID=2019550 RepID=A0ABR4MEM8_9PEZI
MQRVSSLETFAAVAPVAGRSSRRSSIASTRSRKLNFNPMPESWDGVVSKQTNIQAVGAFEVPRWKRIPAGVVFGYAALKPVLKQEGAYRAQCSTDGASYNEIDTCVEMHLNLMFTVAAVSTNVVALPLGAILDRYGPRICGITGAFFLATGSFILAHAESVPFDGYLFGYMALALGGPFTYISAFQLSNAFPRHSGLVLALLTGAFDASSALFLGYRIVYERSGGAFGHSRFFTYYLIVPVIIVLLQIFLLPEQSYKTVGELVEVAEEAEAEADHVPVFEDQIDEHTALLRDEERVRCQSVVADIEELLGDPKAGRQARREERKNEISGVWGVMHTNSALEQISSLWFILICAFTVIQMTRINFFVATIRPQYEAIFADHDAAVAINQFFDMALPLGGIMSIPFIGLFLDNFSTVAVLTTLVIVAVSIGLLGLLASPPAAYLGVCLFVLYRPFYYTAVSDYAAKVFGFRTFGTVYGTIICLAGLFNFSQSGLDYLFHNTFHGNPIPVNIMLLSIGAVLGIALVTFVAVNARRIKRQLLEDEVTAAVYQSSE